MGYDVTKLPERMVRARKARRMTQTDLGMAIGGISPVIISKYELGRQLPSARRLAQLAEALQVTPGWLLGYTKEEEA